MDTGHVVGTLAWLALGVGYALSVWKLARMARAEASPDAEPCRPAVTIAIGEPHVSERRA